jgi:hypothetical protein
MTTTQEAGRKGAQVRNENLGPKGRSEAAKKAAETRKEHDPDAFKKMGREGGSAHGKSSSGSSSSGSSGGQAQSKGSGSQSSSAHSGKSRAEEENER